MSKQNMLKFKNDGKDVTQYFIYLSIVIYLLSIFSNVNQNQSLINMEMLDDDSLPKLNEIDKILSAIKTL